MPVAVASVMNSDQDSQGPSGRRGVFIVDDHPLVRESLASLIARQADLIVCGQAETCGEAFEQIARLQPDAALVDLSLEGESGLDLIKQLLNLP